MDLGPASPCIETCAPDYWIEPMPNSLVVAGGDAACGSRSSRRSSFPPRQRAVSSRDMRWKAAEVAELLETSVASVTSALQRAGSTLEASDV